MLATGCMIGDLFLVEMIILHRQFHTASEKHRISYWMVTGALLRGKVAGV